MEALVFKKDNEPPPGAEPQHHVMPLPPRETPSVREQAKLKVRLRLIDEATTGRSVDLPGFCLRILLTILDIVP